MAGNMLFGGRRLRNSSLTLLLRYWVKALFLILLPLLVVCLLFTRDNYLDVEKTTIVPGVRAGSLRCVWLFIFIRYYQCRVLGNL